MFYFYNIPELKLIRDHLLDKYSELTECVPVSPLFRNLGIPVNELFAAVDLMKNEKSKWHTPRQIKKEKSTRVKTYEDLFTVDGKFADRVFLYGNAGFGKTCFTLKIVNDWCEAIQDNPEKSLNNDESFIKQFDFIFYIEFKHLEDKKGDLLYNIICNDYLMSSSHRDRLDDLSENVGKILLSDKYLCLVILDGLDEWPHGDIPKFSSIKNRVIFISSRQSKLAKIDLKFQKTDCVIEILGLDNVSSGEIADNILSNYYKILSEDLLYKATFESYKNLIEKSTMNSLAKIPLISTFLIILLYEGHNIGDSFTFIYLEIVELLIKKCQKENRINSDELKKLTKNNVPPFLSRWPNTSSLFGVLSKIGEKAYNKIDSDNSELVFHEKSLVKFGLKSGLLTRSVFSDSAHQDMIYTFFHKTVQDFLAAFYIAFGDTGMFERFKLKFTTKSVRELLPLSNILIFISGLDSELKFNVSGFISDISKRDPHMKEIRCQELIEKENIINQLHTMQCSCFQEIIQSQTDNTENLRSLQTVAKTFSVSDVYSYRGNDTTHQVSVQLAKANSESLLSLYLLSKSGELSFDSEWLQNVLKKSRKLQALHVMSVNNFQVNIKMWHFNLSYFYLSGVSLSNTSFNQLVDKISQFSVLKVLNLNNIMIHENRGAMTSPVAPPKLLKCKEGLEILSIENIAFECDRDMCHISVSKSKGLQKITLRDVYISKNTVEDLNTALKRNTGLKLIDLSYKEREITALNVMLSTFSELETVKFVDIHVGDEAVNDISRALQSLESLHLINIKHDDRPLHIPLSTQKKLKELKLIRLSVTDETVEDIATAIQGNEGLEIIQITHVISVSKEIHIPLSSYHSKLEKLRLGNINVSDKTVDDLIVTLKHNTRLETLILDNIKFSQKFLNIDLTSKSNLTNFQLHGIHVNAEAVDNLNVTLQNNVKLETLAMNKISCDEKALIIMLSKHSELKTLKLMNIWVSAETVAELTPTLERNVGLKKLVLSNIRCSEGSSFNIRLQENSELKTIKLSNINVSDEVFKELTSSLQSKDELEVLTLFGIGCDGNEPLEFFLSNSLHKIKSIDIGKMCLFWAPFIQSLKGIDHEFNVMLENVKIDRNYVSCPDFEVIGELTTHENGSISVSFRRKLTNVTNTAVLYSRAVSTSVNISNITRSVVQRNNTSSTCTLI